MTPTHVMVDLETLSTAPNAAIISIGATVFTKHEIIEVFYSEVSLASNFDLGRNVSPSTINWWMRQSDEARQLFANNDKAPALPFVLGEFAGFCVKHQANWLWGNGATFDNVVLRTAFADCGVHFPVTYRGDMCYRTVKSMYPDMGIQREGTHHNALDDAMHQTKYLLALHEHSKVLKGM